MEDEEALYFWEMAAVQAPKIFRPGQPRARDPQPEEGEEEPQVITETKPATAAPSSFPGCLPVFRRKT
jgi:hypothetical protein